MLETLAFISAMDRNLRTPGENRRSAVSRPNAQTDAIALASPGSPTGRQTVAFISAMLRNFLTGI
jgi:hypothetical protein